MKTCNYCKTQIPKEATKCPNCQSFQNKYRNPQFIYGILFPLIMLIPFYFFMTYTHADFTDYSDQISMNVVNIDTLQRGDCLRCKQLNILIELDNQTNKEWKTPQYEITFSSKERKLHNIERSGDYLFILPANSTAISSIKVNIYPEYKDALMDVKLVDLRHDYY